IEAVGENTGDFAPGDRVTYTGSPLGAYSTERVMPVGSLIKLPDGIEFETAAAMTMRGLTAAYLLLRINPWLKAGDTILLHAAAVACWFVPAHPPARCPRSTPCSSP